jgi:putative peptidoglycan lipid II flippase
MSAAVAENRFTDLAYQISLGTRLAAVVLIPVTVVYLVLGQPLAVTLFQWGNYSHQQALDTGWVIAVGGLGLVPFAISQIQLFAFYAMPDTKTPALINLPVVALRIGVDVLFFVLLASSWVAVGLMGGNAISFVLAVVLGYVLLRRRVGPLGLRQVFGTIARLVVAAMIAAIPAVIVVIVLNQVFGADRHTKVASLVELGVGGLVLIATYIGAAFALRVREVRELRSMLRSRGR